MVGVRIREAKLGGGEKTQKSRAEAPTIAGGDTAEIEAEEKLQRDGRGGRLRVKAKDGTSEEADPFRGIAKAKEAKVGADIEPNAFEGYEAARGEGRHEAAGGVGGIGAKDEIGDFAVELPSGRGGGGGGGR